jgi:hypothetical protein
MVSEISGDPLQPQYRDLTALALFAQRSGGSSQRPRSFATEVHEREKQFHGGRGRHCLHGLRMNSVLAQTILLLLVDGSEERQGKRETSHQ